MTNLLSASLFARHRDVEKPFLLAPDGETIRYSEFYRRSSQIANALSTHAGPGDRIIVQVAKSPEALLVHTGAIRAGIVPVPISHRLSEAQTLSFCDEYKPKLIISSSPDLPRLLAGVPVWSFDGESWQSILAAAEHHSGDFQDVPRGADDLAMIMLTSGTTGRSKGCMLTHGNLLSNAQSLAALWRIGASDVVFNALPIYHTHGLVIATNAALVAGASMWFLPEFSVPDALPFVSRSTVIMGTPKMYLDMLASPALDEQDFRKTRLFVSGGSPLTTQTLDEFERRTGHRILERHGMTEASVSLSNPFDGDRRPGTVGLPIPGTQVRIVNPVTGRQLETGEIGLVEVKGPNVFRGYWTASVRGGSVFAEDGYFATGDIGRFQGDGYLEIICRSDDLIVCKGRSIDPREIESLIDHLPGVQESAVVGVPHPSMGQGLVGVVIVSDPSLIADEICRQVEHELNGLPLRIEIVQTLPRTGSGKVQKRELRTRFEDRYAISTEQHKPATEKIPAHSC